MVSESLPWFLFFFLADKKVFTAPCSDSKCPATSQTTYTVQLSVLFADVCKSHSINQIPLPSRDYENHSLDYNYAFSF